MANGINKTLTIADPEFNNAKQIFKDTYQQAMKALGNVDVVKLESKQLLQGRY